MPTEDEMIATLMLLGWAHNGHGSPTFWYRQLRADDGRLMSERFQWYASPGVQTNEGEGVFMTIKHVGASSLEAAYNFEMANK